MSSPQKFLTGAVAVLAMVLALAYSGDWPPFARADTEARQMCHLVNMPVSSGANILTSSLTASRAGSAFRVEFYPKDGETDSTLIKVVEVWNDDESAVLETLVAPLGDDTAVTNGNSHTWTFTADQWSTNGEGGSAVENRKLTYNVRVGTTTEIGELVIHEVPIP